jgi:hypothetical protein
MFKTLKDKYKNSCTVQRLAAGETQTDIARSYGVSHVTIGRLQEPVLRPFDGVGVPAV